MYRAHTGLAHPSSGGTCPVCRAGGVWGSYLHPLVCCTQHFFPHPSVHWSALPFLNYADPKVPPVWLRSQLGLAMSGTEQLQPLLTEPPVCTQTCAPGTTLLETLELLLKS